MILYKRDFSLIFFLKTIKIVILFIYLFKIYKFLIINFLKTRIRLKILLFN